MLLLYLCLFSGYLSLSVGKEIEEFKSHLGKVSKLANTEIFFPVPERNKECECAHDYLNNTVKHLENLTRKFSDDGEVKKHLEPMYLNMKLLMARLKNGNKVHLSKNCGIKEVSIKKAPLFYEKFFESLNEYNCFESQ